MSSVPIRDDQVLREQIAQANDTLSLLEGDLRAIDVEIDSLGTQREQYELLEQVCGTLEKLEELGADGLFWGPASQQRTSQHVGEVRSRLSDFAEQFQEIAQRRETLVGEIKHGQDVLDILEYDLAELEAQEDERRNQWVVERDEIVEPDRQAVMPWSRASADDQRFRRSLSSSLAAALVLGIVIPFIDLPLPDLVEIPEIPERYANLIQQEELPPPPPIVEPQAEEQVPEPEEQLPEPETEPEPVVAEEIPTAEPAVENEPAPPAAKGPPEPEVRSAGILAFRDSFSSLASNRPAAQLGTQARINNAGEAAVGRTERAMITSQGPGSSGGINLAALSRDVGGGGNGQQIDGVEVGRVASSIGGAGGSGGPSSRPRSGGASAGRTDEEIQIVFDRYKASLYRLYNRELRNDPTLRGQVVLQLTIEPDGSVSYCVVKSSDMKAPELEQQVAERVRTFDFGAKDVPAVTILYPIDFLPAA